MKMLRNVLIGSAGTGTAFAAICSLRRIWGDAVKIISMDVNPKYLVTASLLSDEFERVPESRIFGFKHKLKQIIDKHSITTYLPLLPEEIALAATMREDADLNSALQISAPPYNVSIACADKWRLTALLMKNDIPVPHTALVSDHKFDSQAFLKPRDGVGSRGAKKVNIDDLRKELPSNSEGWVLQEICDGPEVTIDCFYQPKTQYLRVVCRERLEVKSGVATKCRLFFDGELEKLAYQLALALSLSGSFCFQVMKNQQGWVITDVNPRPGAGTSMCLLTGNDFFAALFANLWQEDVTVYFKSINKDHIVTRQYADFIMK